MQTSLEQAIPSPCVRNCCLDTNDVCLGCFRALEEITGWHQADPLQRRQILQNAQQRRSAYERRFRTPVNPQ
ncbi:MAG: DUF1289 domain-containing protein [Methylococcaceae bacterium]|nr:MAG: DUF1289 domain-containing protein [Methylococcaceae bacterium]